MLWSECCKNFRAPKQCLYGAAKASMGVLHTVSSLMKTRNTTESRQVHMKIKAHV